MEDLISNQGNLQSVPESYILPPDRRPGTVAVPVCEAIPVIDLERLRGGDRKGLIQEIMKASQEYGFFQVTNHGVSEELMKDVLMVGEEFFQLPAEEKASFCQTSYTTMETCRVRTSLDYANESVHFWRDNLRHACHPLEDNIQNWPANPPRYRDVVGRYSVEVRKLSMWIMDLICEGLGLEPGYFEGELSKKQVISNGLLKSSDHRAVTNTDVARMSAVSFIIPCIESVIEPATTLVNECNRRVYKAFRFADFLKSFIVDTREGGGDPLRHYMA